MNRDISFLWTVCARWEARCNKGLTTIILLLWCQTLKVSKGTGIKALLTTAEPWTRVPHANTISRVCSCYRLFIICCCISDSYLLHCVKWVGILGWQTEWTSKCVGGGEWLVWLHVYWQRRVFVCILPRSPVGVSSDRHQSASGNNKCVTKEEDRFCPCAHLWVHLLDLSQLR